MAAEKKTSLQENIETRIKRIEAYNKVFEGKKIKELHVKEIALKDLEIECKKIENDVKKNKRNGYNSELDDLLAISRAWYVNNDKTSIGSDPVIESLWNAEEIEYLKVLIMRKADKL